eukprot:1142872-Pelagomonas_calceolata.AAC.1
MGSITAGFLLMHSTAVSVDGCTTITKLRDMLHKSRRACADKLVRHALPFALPCALPMPCVVL